MDTKGLIALLILLLPVLAMLIDMIFHQRRIKKLRKEASEKTRIRVRGE